MTHLPAHPADEAATKADVATLKDRFDRLEDRFDRLEDRLDHWQRTTLVVVVSAMTGLTAIFSAIVLVAP